MKTLTLSEETIDEALVALLFREDYCRRRAEEWDDNSWNARADAAKAAREEIIRESSR